MENQSNEELSIEVLGYDVHAIKIVSNRGITMFSKELIDFYYKLKSRLVRL